MEKQIRSFVRIMVAGVVVMAGTGVVSTQSAQASTTDVIKSSTVLQDGPAPAPLCSPSNPKCQMPVMF